MTAMHETPDDQNADNGTDDVDNDPSESMDAAATTPSADAPSEPATVGTVVGRSANIGHT